MLRDCSSSLGHASEAKLAVRKHKSFEREKFNRFESEVGR